VFSKGDPFVVVKFGGLEQKTEVKHDTLNPVYDEGVYFCLNLINIKLTFFFLIDILEFSLTVPYGDNPPSLTFEVWDEDLTSKNNLIGRIEFDEILPFLNNTAELEFEMCKEGDYSKPQGKLRVELLYEIEEEIIDEIGEREDDRPAEELEEPERHKGGILYVNIVTCNVCKFYFASIIV
jgi:Ca2+-dependent lipid-binding protein